MGSRPQSLAAAVKLGETGGWQLLELAGEGSSRRDTQGNVSAILLFLLGDIHMWVCVAILALSNPPITIDDRVAQAPPVLIDDRPRPPQAPPVLIDDRPIPLRWYPLSQPSGILGLFEGSNCLGGVDHAGKFYWWRDGEWSQPDLLPRWAPAPKFLPAAPRIPATAPGPSVIPNGSIDFRSPGRYVPQSSYMPFSSANCVT